MKFDYRRRIYLKDTDAAGVVYFATGLTICHEAYEESLAETGINLKQIIAEGKTALPIVRAEIDFLKPFFCHDLVRVSLSANLVNDSEFAIAYQICLADNPSRISIKAYTRHVCIDPHLRQRTDLPAAFLAWLKS